MLGSHISRPVSWPISKVDPCLCPADMLKPLKVVKHDSSHKVNFQCNAKPNEPAFSLICPGPSTSSKFGVPVANDWFKPSKSSLGKHTVSSGLVGNAVNQ